MTWEAVDRMKSVTWTPMEMGQAYGAKIMEFSVKNAASALRFAEEVSRAKTPTEVSEAVTNHTRRQFESLTDQFRQLSTLVQEGAKTGESESAGLGD
jgi:hypothetical protein